MTDLEPTNRDTLKIIESIHRSGEGHIGFVSKGTGSEKFEAVAAVDIRDLKNMLPPPDGGFYQGSILYGEHVPQRQELQYKAVWV